jgi:hypothetical protein
LEAQTVIEKLKSCTSPGTHQLLELIQAAENTLCSELDKLVNSIQNKK